MTAFNIVWRIIGVGILSHFNFRRCLPILADYFNVYFFHQAKLLLQERILALESFSRYNGFYF